MTLSISYNWLKEYVKIYPAKGHGANLTPQEFAKKISLSGPSVDRVNETKLNFDKVVVGQIKTIEQHPNADKLHVCKVDVGPHGAKTAALGGKQSELQIVCGAPNIKEGQKVPVVLVGGKVGEFEIKEAKLRGVESFGMMCSQKELGLGEDHTGIYILPEDAQAGQPLESILPPADAVLEIEITSNRPDAMSVIGIAREAAAILGEKFLYRPAPADLAVESATQKLKVKVKEPKLCPRYSAIVMTDVKVGASPLWMQQRLSASGLRPINNLVDITNYILLEYGQPMHVFDYDKLQSLSNSPLRKGREEGAEINVRKAKAGEKILALDGKEYELSADNLVIADKENPVAVAGVMGGELSAASAETKTIVFECANFDPVSVRKTSRALNLRSESSALYEKGISPENVTAAMLRAVELAKQLAGAKVASKLIDEKSYKRKDKKIKLDLAGVNQALGVNAKPATIKTNLEALGFSVSAKKDYFEVAIPWWRENDIEGQHDLIEEIARMYGYHNLPSELMAGALPKSAKSPAYALEDKIKDILAGFGLTEVYAYSFISEKQIIACGLDPADHIRIANPLSLDFEYMRVSLLPGLLQIISENQGLYPSGKIFELSKVYLPLGPNDLADEKSKLVFICYGNKAAEAAADARGILDGLAKRLNLADLSLKNYESGCEIFSGKDKLGEIKNIDGKILSGFGIKKAVASVELDFAALAQTAKSAPAYKPIPKFPAIELDLSMEIDNVVSFAEAANIAYDAGAPLAEKIDFLSVYQGDSQPADGASPKASGGASKLPEGKKALAIRIVYRDLNKTLELKEAQAAHDKVVVALKKEYNIVVR